MVTSGHAQISLELSEKTMAQIVTHATYWMVLPIGSVLSRRRKRKNMNVHMMAPRTPRSASKVKSR